MSDPLVVRPYARWFRLAIAGAAAACLVLSLGGCKDESGALESVYKKAPSGPAGVASALQGAFFTEDITANGAINLAHERLEKVGDPASVTFALGVLQFLEIVEPDISPKVINDFFWMRVGTLAANTATAARKLEDLPTARAAVLAGPKAWKTDAYWQQHPSHDALASLILFESKEGDEALKRLRDRADMAEEVAKAKEFIEAEMRKGRGR